MEPSDSLRKEIFHSFALGVALPGLASLVIGVDFATEVFHLAPVCVMVNQE